MISPKVLKTQHSTDDIPHSSKHSSQYWWYPQHFWILDTVRILSLTVLNTLHSTEYPPQYWMISFHSTDGCPNRIEHHPICWWYPHTYDISYSTGHTFKVLRRFPLGCLHHLLSIFAWICKSVWNCLFALFTIKNIDIHTILNSSSSTLKHLKRLHTFANICLK